MPTPHTPTPLDERVHHHREALTVLMAGAGRCDDILSGQGGIGLNVLSGSGVLGTGDDTGSSVKTPGVSTGSVSDLATDGTLVHRLRDDDPLTG